MTEGVESKAQVLLVEDNLTDATFGNQSIGGGMRRVPAQWPINRQLPPAQPHRSNHPIGLIERCRKRLLHQDMDVVRCDTLGPNRVFRGRRT